MAGATVQAQWIPVGADRFGEHHPLGTSTIDVKLSSEDTGGALLIIEHTSRVHGGPARHLHHGQEEWFHALEGEFVVEVGDQRFHLSPGDSVLAPREVPHVWAHVAGHSGRLLIAFVPAGKMEGFFAEVGRTNAMPVQDPILWRQFGMELVGPPLVVE
jgi:quercetin dioxygenase-like cupin family protein